MRVSHTPWALLYAGAATLIGTSLAEHVIHERVVESTDQWLKLGSINRNGLLPVRIGLTQQNLEHGHKLLMERSDPDSPNYGQHMTQEEVNDLFAPHQDTVDAVHNWLEAEGIKLDRVSQSNNRQWVQFHATVDELEKLINATYDIYEHKETGTRHVGTDEYSIPAELLEHIDYITPAVTRLQISGEDKARKLRRDVEVRDPNNDVTASPPFGHEVTSNCNDYITPRCIRNMYNIPLGQSAVEGNELGIYERQPYNQTALSLFFKTFSPFIPTNTTPLINSIDGAPILVDDQTASTTGDGETMLDIIVAYPIVHPQNVRVYFVDDLNYEVNVTQGYFNTFLDALDGSYCNRTAFNITGDSPEYDPTYPDPNGYKGERMCGVFKPTNVISISWSPEEQQRSVNYDRRQCSEWMKLSLQGVTIVAATGDFGVAGNGGSCIEDANGNRTIFNPLALTNCPYVLAVGSTQLAPGNHDGKEGNEVGTVDLPSSGGFSNIYPTPEWQKNAIDKYFHENPSPYKFYNTTLGKDIGAGGGLFNRGGRGFPDISANGLNVVTVDFGVVFRRGGTSAAAPLVASILNRINGERLKAGKPTLGFVTPALYANPSILNDVTVGNSAGCDTSGFVAAKGWDPVTGLGTPDYPRMLKYFMSLDSK
ncbi:alkaline serine protease [Trichoderma arundinaceum]|uniref:tripeptidyl-peptidase II n=1 Tax=Trichoderma arundinaceum TaxID=490622 RepID=A0A395NC14_TRIAR|nr:alkaline serine protease [Trichoderma arundinaceum]